MAGNGLVWNEALPDDDVVANEIDEYNRDLRIAVRLRLAREHVFPAADNTGTVNAAGHHNFITLQAQVAASVMAGTTAGALWVKSSDLGIYITNSTANDILLVTGATLRVITTGTLGSVVICSSANPNSIITLVGSADGRVLHTHSNTAAPNWLPIDLAGTSTVLTGLLTGTSMTSLLGAWVDKSASYGAQQAASDGFVVAQNAAGYGLSVYTDANADPTTLRGGCSATSAFSATVPIKKGDYWKVTVTGGTPTVFWIPLGA